jgi:predicted transcriptional regulator
MNLSDEQKLEALKKAIEKGEEDIKAGRTKPAAEVFKRLREKIRKKSKGGKNG